MKRRITIINIIGLLFLFSSWMQAQYSLEVIQKFPESSAGKKNQVKFADVNGDGKKDLIAVYIAPNNVGEVVGIWLYNEDSSKFSSSVSCTINLNFKNKQCWMNVGDVNGDGKADIIMASQYGGHHPPKIVYGRETFPASITTADLNCNYPNDPDFQTMGQYTSIGIGDFNNDGIADIIFPEQGTSIELGDYGGRMMMYFGGTSMTGDPDMVFHYPGNQEGYVMNPDTNKIYLRWFSPFISKGDFNGDGIDDIFTSGFYSYSDIEFTSLVSNKKTRADNVGAGVVFFGGSDIDTIPDVIMVPPLEFIQYTTATDFMYCGYWVFNAGDINGDGADELSLPSWYWGINFVYKGMKGMEQVPSQYQTVVLRDPAFYFTKNRYNTMGYADQNGAMLIPIGDINGDGIPDLGNTRNYFGNGPDDHGVRIFFGKKTLAGAIDTSFVTDEYSQIQESNIDFNDDGRADLVMNDLDGYLCLVKLNIPTSVELQEMNIPRAFVLEQNYPNPFNPSTTIKYTLPNAMDIKLEVFNVLGQKVKTLVDEFQQAGEKQVVFNGSELSSGVYMYRLESADYRQAKIMILQK